MRLDYCFAEVCNEINGSPYTIRCLAEAAGSAPETVPLHVRRLVGDRVKARSGASWGDVEIAMSYNETVSDYLWLVEEMVLEALSI